jgi:hypothetical protein
LTYTTVLLLLTTDDVLPTSLQYNNLNAIKKEEKSINGRNGQKIQKLASISTEKNRSASGQTVSPTGTHF